MFTTRIAQLTYHLAPASQHRALLEFTQRAHMRVLQFSHTLQRMPPEHLIMAVAMHQQTPMATLITQHAHSDTSWIRACAIMGVASNEHTALVGHLLQTCISHAPTQRWFFHADISEYWLRDLLLTRGFSHAGAIVALESTRWQTVAPALPTNLQLRIMHQHDLPHVRALDVQVFATQWHKTAFEIEEVWSTPGHAVVVTHEDTLVAYAMAVWHNHQASLHIVRIAVAPAWQQRGIARAIMAHIGHYASQLDAQRITLNTQHDNQAALTLYAQMGFTLTQETYPVICSDASTRINMS